MMIAGRTLVVHHYDFSSNPYPNAMPVVSYARKAENNGRV
jgi:hypothetical protein